MSQLPPADQSPQTTTPVYEPAFETAVHGFWVRNRQAMLVMCVTALLAIVGTYAWQSIAAGRELDVQAEYARISDQPAKLEGFATANSGHPLAGVAWLRLADEKFSAGDFKTAAANYQKATGSLKDEALLGRAKLGAAMSQLNGGDIAGGSAALKAVSTDTTLAKGARAEAAYQLVALAADAGQVDEVKKLAEEVSKIDATSSWAQRATLLIVSPAVAAKPGDPKPADASLTFKTPGK